MSSFVKCIAPCCYRVKISTSRSDHDIQIAFGEYQVFENIEGELEASFGTAFFMHKEAAPTLYLHKDRHKHWIVGSGLGKARGSLKSGDMPLAPCPCQVKKWMYWDNGWKDDRSITIQCVEKY